MTTTAELTAQINALRKTLAEATKVCFFITAGVRGHNDTCDECQGKGRVPRFPGFRQDCQCLGDERWVRLGCPKCWYLGAHSLDCTKCNGTGWHVCAGGLEAALAGLDNAGFMVWQSRWPFAESGSVPRPEILAEGLRLVIEVAGLGE